MPGSRAHSPSPDPDRTCRKGTNGGRDWSPGCSHPGAPRTRPLPVESEGRWSGSAATCPQTRQSERDRTGTRRSTAMRVDAGGCPPSHRSPCVRHGTPPQRARQRERPRRTGVDGRSAEPRGRPAARRRTWLPRRCSRRAIGAGPRSGPGRARRSARRPWRASTSRRASSHRAARAATRLLVISAPCRSC